MATTAQPKRSLPQRPPCPVPSRGSRRRHNTVPDEDSTVGPGDSSGQMIMLPALPRAVRLLFKRRPDRGQFNSEPGEFFALPLVLLDPRDQSVTGGNIACEQGGEGGSLQR